ncbi:MAG TPA: response regulator [Zoogloea sp.]|jgi:FixJ family two-component response regulator|uniref:response regulator transcription factor n=1 Tax=Zoogloea sp. TaxID=49181 RepID=UPI001B6EEF53|nr:response regulator [Zoogloea sp.]MBP8267691.1 response regulator transcription factor [Zoogloea sp.]HOB44950.1 response regulator [Zoogloea sp.]HQA08948.1 response regulator [Zoogloea sp.]HQE39178.1 response regulator [Zoogloea sp.]
MGGPLVCVVDDDDAVRLSIGLLIETLGLPVRCFSSALDVLADGDALDRAHCLVLDVRMPGLSGIVLQDRLIRLGRRAPIIFVSAHGDVPMVARAMRDGAFDFLQKPFNEQVLLDRVQEAVQFAARSRRQSAWLADIHGRLDSLTARERDVMDGMVAGRLNKQIAEGLGISMKTVEQHRARVMEKLQVDSLAELVRIVVRSGCDDG